MIGIHNTTWRTKPVWLSLSHARAGMVPFRFINADHMWSVPLSLTLISYSPLYGVSWVNFRSNSAMRLSKCDLLPYSCGDFKCLDFFISIVFLFTQNGLLKSNSMPFICIFLIKFHIREMYLIQTADAINIFKSNYPRSYS